MRNVSVLLFPIILAGCNSDDIDLPDLDQRVIAETNFNNGKGGWEAGFSDYPQGDEETYEFESKISEIPDSDVKGFYLSAMNRSDDVFMYLKKHVTGLTPNQRYLLEGTIEFNTNAGVECLGIGGSPGESVYLKAGATEIEPAQADYYMNIDIGSQSQSGSDSVVLGTIGVENVACDSEKAVGQKVLTFRNEDGFEFISSVEGDIWLYFGTDSGFEGNTKMIYRKSAFTITPV